MVRGNMRNFPNVAGALPDLGNEGQFEQQAAVGVANIHPAFFR
jgi:hypothetical protein